MRRRIVGGVLLADGWDYHARKRAAKNFKLELSDCIIRAALLEDISEAFHARRDLPNLLLDPNLSHKVMHHQEDLRKVVCQAAGQSYPGPAGLFRSLHL
jgi:6-phosphogluconate dehydrogenase